MLSKAGPCSRVGSASVDEDGDVLFDRVNTTVRSGRTAEFALEVDFYGVAEGFTGTLVAQVLDIYVEDADFEEIDVDSQLPLGDDVTFNLLINGITTELDGVTQTTQQDGTVGKYTFTVDVTAVGEDFYLGDDSVETGDVTVSSGTVSGVIVTSSGSTTTNGNYRVREGETRTFTVEVFATRGTDGTQNVTLNTIDFSVADDTTYELSVTGLGYRSGSLYLSANN